MRTDLRYRAFAGRGTIVLGLLVAMVAAAGETDCTNCSEDPRFPEAIALLEDAGYSAAEYTVLLTWQEVAPKSAGVMVTGYRVRHDIGGAVFDLYTDGDGALLNAAALAQLGIRPKNWDLRPLTTEPEPVRGGVKRSVRSFTPHGVKDLDNAAVARVALGAVDVARLIDEDEAGELNIPKGVLRTGVFREFPVVRLDGVSATAGEWRQLEDGTWLWSLVIRSKGAVGQRVHIGRLSVPDGAECYLYNAGQPNEVYGPLESGEDFWTPTCFGESVVIECHLSSDEQKASLALVVDKTIHVYRELTSLPWTKAVGACNIDSTCYPDWSVQASGVGGIGTIGIVGSLWCTGSLVVDRDPSTQIPYFLTANHCVGNAARADTIEVYWLYQTEECDGVPPDPAFVPRTTGGADFVAGVVATSGSDFTLLRLRNTPPAGIAYLGWSTVDPAPASEVVCIHHPRGSFKRIALGTLGGGADPCLLGDAPDVTRYHQVFWHDGITEPGSSGSPLFNADTQRVVGQLWGGMASCSLPECPDYYGRFSFSFPLMDQYLGQGPAVEFDETAYSVSEGDGTVEIHVSLASAPSAAFDVQFETLPGTATAGLDYEAASGVLTFTPTEYTRVIDIPVVSDFRPEVTESFHVALYYEGIELATGAVTIADDDPDTDGDGLSDYEEQNSLWGYASDPLLADTDHDRLSDWEEVSGFYGFVSDPSVSDTDGDGFSDYLESRFGLDPRDDLVFPTAIPSLEMPSW